MANDLVSLRFTNFDGLLNAGVSDFLMLNNELSACKNVWVYKIGKLEKVPGYSLCSTVFISTSPSTSPSASVSPSTSFSTSPSASLSPSASSPNSYSPSTSVSVSPSMSISISPSASLSISPSISPSASTSLSPSVSAPNSFSPSTSPSPSLSASQSPSGSPSAGQVVDNRSVSYLHYYYDTANRAHYLLATADDGTGLTLRYRTTGHWTTITGIASSWAGYETAQTDMENYLGKTFIVGYYTGSTFLPSATVTATTFSTSDANITDMPQAKYVVRYRDLLYVLHCKLASGAIYPTRAYYCDEPTAGAITWANLTTSFLEFGYDDGDEITGGAECFDRLIVFKTKSMWKYDESSVQQIADIGCDSNRSIQKVNRVLYWYNRDGFWRWRGAQPELISAKAQPFIDAMDQTTLTSVVATPYNGFEYRAFIGTVTVEGITYTNAWFCWDTRREKCYIRCTYDTAKSACSYQENGTRRAYFGNDDGYVFKFATKVDAVYSDNGNQIDSFFITKNLDYGVPEDLKLVNRMTVFAKHASNMKIAIDADNRGEFNEANTQILRKEDIPLIANAKRFRYKFYEKGLGKSWQFEGFVIQTKGTESWT